MSEQWYYTQHQQRFGPFPTEQLRQLIAARQIPAETLVWQPGMAGWVAALTVPDLTAPPPPAARSVAVTATPPPQPELLTFEVVEEPAERLRLWNPTAAANWSLLFSPVFGTYLHARNWETLGKPHKARANLVWMWITVGFLVVVLLSIFFVDSGEMNLLLRACGFAILLGWYFSLGKSQITYLKEEHLDYEKREWKQPLGIAVGALFGYFVVAFILGLFFYTPSPEDIAVTVKPAILAEWKKSPETRSLAIQKIHLVHKGGKVYTGHVDVEVGGQIERLKLEVIFDRGQMVWKLGQ